MKAVALLLVATCALAAAAVASRPVPPTIAGSFSATLTVTGIRGVTKLSVWSDAANGRFLTRANEGQPAVAVSNLFLTTAYNAAAGSTEYTYSAAGACSVGAVGKSRRVPSLFAWVADAEAIGASQWRAGALTLTVAADGVTPRKLVTADGLTIAFDSFVAGAPAASVFAVPAGCAAARHNAGSYSRALAYVRPAAVQGAVAALAGAPGTATPAAAAAATSGNLGIHWKCDLCKAAAEPLISVGCGGGSALCGPFAEVCEDMCEGGCLAAGCSDRVCKKFGFC